MICPHKEYLFVNFKACQEVKIWFLVFSKDQMKYSNIYRP